MVGRLDSIQVMRGLAALLVFAFHLVVTVDRYTPAELRGWVDFGQIGVDLFFVISGFVMAHSTRSLTTAREATQFLVRRLWRIAPLLYVVASAHILWSFAFGRPPGLGAILNCFAILPVAEAAEGSAYALIPAWTLGFELAFYLLVAVAVTALDRWRLPVLILALLLLPQLPVPWPAAFAPYGDALMMEFAFGVGLWILWNRNLISRRFSIAAGLLAICAAAFTVPDMPEPDSRAFAWGIPAALAFAAMLALVPTNKGVGRALIWLGSASYSLYLCHVVVVDAAAPVLVPWLPLPIVGPLLGLLGLSATWWLHSRFELPLLSLPQRIELGPAVATPTLGERIRPADRSGAAAS